MELCYLPSGMLQRVAKNTWAHNEKYPKALSASSFFRVQGQGHSVCLPFVCFSPEHLAQPLPPVEPCGVCRQACTRSSCDKKRNRGQCRGPSHIGRIQRQIRVLDDVLFLAYGANFTREMLAV